MDMLWEREAKGDNPDQTLAVRCRSGDREAFGHLYTIHERAVFRYAFHLMGNREDADDVKQETFLRAYQAIEGYRNEASFRTWLFRICSNLCRDRIKSWERRNVAYHADFSSEIEQYESPDESPHRIVERAQTLQIIMNALQHLPVAQRELIVLHEIEGLDYIDIGTILGCNRVSVKLRVFRARRMLQERVQALLK